MRLSLFSRKVKWLWLVFPAFVLILSACGHALQPEATATIAPTVVPATPTPIPPKTFVVCIGQEPESLYFYKNTSRAGWSVLEAIYDGPFDTENYEYTPVILKNIPTLENGGVTLRSAIAAEGDPVASVTGDVVALAKGVKVFPAGCTSSDCAVEWDGSAPVELVQMVVTFDLLDGILWSDGQPLTAEDSVFSYTVSADPATNVTKTNINRTFSYEAVDADTIRWTGQPGYLTLNPAAFFWLPLPKHALSGLTPEQMMSDPLTNTKPLGWGAYMIDEWVTGDRIRLVKNHNYYRAGEGLPYFDVLVYRFLPSTPEADLSMALTGECDIIDTSVGLENQIIDIRQLELDGKLKAYFGMGPEWEALNFGINPASYDDGYNPYNDRADFFSDVRMRQAVAYCVDREKIQTNITLNQSDIPVTYLPPNHPFAATDTVRYAHTPAAGIQLLEEMGWVDEDSDPATPRVARGVTNVLDGTLLTLSYYATESPLHLDVSSVINESLGECGIQVQTSFLPVDRMFATGAEGPVFGRNYDLAELAWSTGRQPPCFLYTSSEIPTAANKWLGTRYGGVNFSGFSNAEYDAACASALSAGLNRDLLASSNLRMQQILMEELPVLPLFFHVNAMVSRPDLCGLTLDVTSRSPLKDIETFTLADVCPGN